MSIEALVLGKLHQRPEQRISGNTGRPFVTAKVRAAAGDEAGVFVNVVAFSDTAARALLALDAGDSLALAGTLKPGAWIDREGNARPQLDMVAAQVLTTYGLKKKRDAVADAAAPAAPAPARHPAGDVDTFGHADDDEWLRGGA
ncbi:MAG: hypothetical protein RIQ60_1920 [Pseudomonadota bacterium]|jgi:single-stranded DNA-binding protein